jgi:hypothetical protein
MDRFLEIDEDMGYCMMEIGKRVSIELLILGYMGFSCWVIFVFLYLLEFIIIIRYVFYILKAIIYFEKEVVKIVFMAS